MTVERTLCGLVHELSKLSETEELPPENRLPIVDRGVEMVFQERWNHFVSPSPHYVVRCCCLVVSTPIPYTPGGGEH